MMRRHRRAHALIWATLAVVLPVAIGIGLLAPARLPPDAPPVRLDAPGEGGSP